MTTTHTSMVQAIQPPPDLDKLAETFVAAFPGLDAEGQGLAMTLYRLLSEGQAVSYERLAQALNTPTETVSQTLSQWPAVFYDESGHIIGFWGLTVKKTRHRLHVDGATVYAWCAWDTLFLPELLGATATVTSTCAASGGQIRLTVSPTRIEAAEPGDVVVSFLVPEKEELRKNVTTSFCHFVYFFRSRKDGETWVDEHDGTFLLSLEDAFVVGQKKNALRFGDALGTKV
ncbi:MAG: organomercurial lyase MerB [Gammaproteobacteria bacterium]|nr:MAG: organomercurial lyase MerB [Gammaproteobacteria bacterium]